MTNDHFDTAPGAVRVAGDEIAIDDAFAVIAGYCLGEEEISWQSPISGVGDRLTKLLRGAFAYETYDCIPPSVGSRLEPIDVLVADGLNAQMRASDIAGVLGVAEEVSQLLARIGPAVTFWNLPREAVAQAPADEDGTAWAMWRAWTVLMGVDGIDLARTHKILHHKRPAVFPLIDNQTVEKLGQAAWAAIHDDLSATDDAWSMLESEIKRLLESRRKPALYRLRLHDILLWTKATRRWAIAHRYGAEELAKRPRGNARG